MMVEIRQEANQLEEYKFHFIDFFN